ncbi:hypothetical protein Taro_044405 [Colocasia esculenta]|uniref:Cytochrome b561 and DOMON domain-containing protein n=1 Tax=Colocasia esculenta TaxID=4460 RepID=A0A843X2M6_COLES|nr:hypothetical protein [Colocasia esculenta]
MARYLRRPQALPLLCPFFLLLLVPVSSAVEAAQAGCSAKAFSGNRRYALCSDLPTLDSTLHWTHDAAASTLRLAFSARPDAPGGWVSWGINPAEAAMLGTRSLIAFHGAGGAMDVGTYNLSSYDVRKSRIEYEVSELEAESGADGRMTIFAAVRLPAGTTKVYQVWQVGASVSNGVPDKHGFGPANMAAKGILDLVTGGTSASGSDSKLRKRNIHGVLNAVSWGVLLPLGAVMARYLKTFKSADPAWFYLHVSCQLTGYAVGVAGWGTGLYLGNKSKGFHHTTHRSIGIALFCLATLQVPTSTTPLALRSLPNNMASHHMEIIYFLAIQVFALFLRPSKESKYRIFWNVYHHAVGYAVIILGVFNVFEGLSILQPAKKWRAAYVAAIAILGTTALLLEVVAWIVHVKKKSEDRAKSKSSSAAAAELPA